MPVISGGSRFAKTSAVKIWTAIGAGLIALAGWALWLRLDPSASGAAASSTVSPVEARQRQLLERNAGLAGDPALLAAYRAINTAHFGGALPEMAVRWEPGLADVGALAVRTFTLEGMYGRVGKRHLILLNPSLKTDPQALTRALCHEMVHAYLFATGDTTTNHGPEFKSVLQRLSAEGAFEGIAATDEERASLRAWLDEESARLDQEKAAVEAMRREVTPDQAAAFNDRLRRDQEDLAHFNAEVSRYNLMIVYPDGFDDDEPLPARASIPRQ
jgi:hypothetical protein